MIGKQIGHYTILERIGGGGMGVVYKAEDTRLGRAVALKLLPPDLTPSAAARKRFLHEARAASVIDHPNVCHVYEVGETPDGRLFMAMTLCDGESLRDLLQRGPLPPREAFEIVFAAAQGVWAAHRRGVVHRDLKPANIMLTGDGLVKIVDFGLALLIGHSRVTSTGVTVGTVAYMSPEQASGEEVDARTDIWSLGVVLYELLTGRIPFRGEINPAIVYSIVHEPHIPVRESRPDVPESCAEIIDRCLQKDRDQRYPSIEALLQEMVSTARKLGWEGTVASRTIAPILRLGRRRRARRVALAGAAVAITILVAWAVWHGRDRGVSPYTTPTRLAVMPLDNLLGAEHASFVSALSIHLSSEVAACYTASDRAWVVPHTLVTRANLPGPEAAAESFGVNRVITGDVQRFEGAHRLALAVSDAQRRRVVRRVTVEFDATRPDSLMPRLARAIDDLLGRSPPPGGVTRDGVAARLYLDAIAGMRDAEDPVQTTRVATMLDSCVARDAVFVPALLNSALAALEVYAATRETEWRDRARDRANRARALAPGRPLTWYVAGEVANAFGATDSAEAAYRRGLSIAPGHHSLSRRLVTALRRQSRLSEAEAVLIAAVESEPDYFAARRSLGDFYLDQGRRAEATEQLLLARALAPQDVGTLNDLGGIYYMDEDWPRARELFARAFRIRPSCNPCNNLATALYFEGNYVESAKYFEFAMQYCDTTQYLAWGNWASALYWAEDDHQRAFDVYAVAIRKVRAHLEANPDDADAAAQLIDYCVMSGREAEARAAIAAAEKFMADQPGVMYSVGSAYEVMGERETALNHLGAALRHGYSRSEVLNAPALARLVEDTRFQDMIRSEAAAPGAEAASRPER